MKLATGFAVLTLAVASAYSVPSFAVVEDHSNASNPAARCQGSLPVFETLIRKRPLAVQNEGNSATFITCSFEFDSGNAVNNTAFLVDTYFTNNGSAPATVTCSAVTGYQTGDNEYVSVSETIAPGGQGNPFWLDTDFADDGMATGLVSISCNIPAGVGINDTYIFWEADDAV